MKKGDIYLAPLDPAEGAEIQKTRPVVVFQNDLATKYGKTVTIIPISSKPFKALVFEVSIPKNSRNRLYCDSKALVHQIRTVDQKRLIKKIGRIDSGILDELVMKLKLHLGIE